MANPILPDITKSVRYNRANKDYDCIVTIEGEAFFIGCTETYTQGEVLCDEYVYDYLTTHNTPEKAAVVAIEGVPNADSEEDAAHFDDQQPSPHVATPDADEEPTRYPVNPAVVTALHEALRIYQAGVRVVALPSGNWFVATPALAQLGHMVLVDAHNQWVCSCGQNHTWLPPLLTAVVQAGDNEVLSPVPEPPRPSRYLVS
jgi:hypothetical protein